MTVHLQDSWWWQRLAERNNIPVFRRVTGIYLDGPRFKSDLLPQLAKFHELQELELMDTSISDSDLETWKLEHPQVAVRAASHGIPR